jgi:hypothetical protein
VYFDDAKQKSSCVYSGGYSRDGGSFLRRSKNEHPAIFRNDGGALRPECPYFGQPLVQLAAEEAVGAVFVAAELVGKAAG